MKRYTAQPLIVSGGTAASRWPDVAAAWLASADRLTADWMALKSQTGCLDANRLAAAVYCDADPTGWTGGKFSGPVSACILRHGGPVSVCLTSIAKEVACPVQFCCVHQNVLWLRTCHTRPCLVACACAFRSCR